MASELDHLAKLQLAVQMLHRCEAVYRRTVPVHELFRGKTFWKGDVVVFDLIGHPKARRCYAWSQLDGAKDERKRFIAILEIPPVKDAKTAVQASIMADETNR